MSNCAVTIFPQRDCSTVSQQIHVKCGEFVMVEGFCIPDDVCIKFWKIIEDKCKCEYLEKPFCVAGSQVGIDDECPTALLTMPGCYVAYLCGECLEFEEDFIVKAETIKCLDNLSVTLQGVALGA